MTVIRPVRPDEITTFTDLAAATEERNLAARAAVEDLFAKTTSRPEWCFVADDGGQTVASVCLWTRPGHDVPTDLVMLEAGPDETGLALVAFAGEFAAAHGATRQGYALDFPAAPAQHHATVEGRDALLTASGFHLARDGMRFRWTSDREVPADRSGLRWVPITETGRDAFVDLLETVIVDTPDGWISADIAEHGLRKAAETVLADMEEMRHEPHWFEIGYDEAGLPAAVSMPAANSNVSVLGFVGVAQGHRGRGYATAVAARGTGILAATGVDEIRGDCDKGNPAMVRAFLRSGYDNFTNRRDYTRAL
ncbi:RimJ/RimL family protein N-acetyltransferase [Allocatelliglobosispora scoriae]|uniref:RimJ/RimL family protein N-acetyltransferase n=1 Tax=Allocatelliglobosispora scoriae TaxID=643052 RepID=A0A841C2Y0_9ACTN|nr:GNAT family N-acetyltransferase [Allocatelliglobosispora scoriae]MBB5873201.1 RimJ/RimL family protein N-acetyltransferase [Allocatelliglobosispora scoriae]